MSEEIKKPDDGLSWSSIKWVRTEAEAKQYIANLENDPLSGTPKQYYKTFKKLRYIPAADGNGFDVQIASVGQ